MALGNLYNGNWGVADRGTLCHFRKNDMDGSAQVSNRNARVLRLPSGRRIGVTEFGDPAGLPVLAFHGAPASRSMFDVTDQDAQRLGLRIIAFDRPGYGLSPLDYGATLERRTQAFAELADALELERFSIIGVSGGGPYAVALAARLRDRIAALALISPLGPVAEISEPHHIFQTHAQVGDGAHGEAASHVRLSFGHRAFFLDLPRHPWVLRVNAEVAMRSFRMAPRLFAQMFAHLLPEADRDVVADAAVTQSIVDMTLEATREGIGGGIADLEIYAAPWDVDYAAITARTKVWQGLDDLIVPVEAAVHLARVIRGCELERIPGAGHFWVYRHIAPVLAELREQIVGTKRDVPELVLAPDFAGSSDAPAVALSRSTA